MAKIFVVMVLTMLALTMLAVMSAPDVPTTCVKPFDSFTWTCAPTEE